VDAELANARLQLLVEGSKRLSPRLNPNGILQVLAELVIPALADWSYILHRGWHDGALVTASAHGDPNKEALLARLGQFPLASQDPGPGRVFRTGEVALYEDVLPEQLSSGPQAQLLAELGVRSLLCVPIMGRSSVDAVMTLVSSGDPHRFGHEEVLLAEDLGARAAVSLENGRLLFEALDAVRARDEFMAVAAHELRTPLTSLILQVQLLRQAAGREPPNIPAASRSVAAVDSQARRLSNLVDGLLDVSRLSSKQMGLRLERIDLRALLEGVVLVMAPDFQRAGCRINLTAPARATVAWDRGRIEQVLTNLLGNAIKFGAGRPIELDAEVLGSIAEISIRDHGIGIAKEDQARIFGRFERAVSTRHFGGLGLGLYISAQILRAHRGSIRVESEPGTGARFVISLPRGIEDTAVATDSSPAP
jgi:signal transduction histidine kinase